MEFLATLLAHLSTTISLLLRNRLRILFFHYLHLGAMWTAGSNFHHLVREERDQKHTLTQNGVYRYSLRGENLFLDDFSFIIQSILEIKQDLIILL